MGCTGLNRLRQKFDFLMKKPKKRHQNLPEHETSSRSIFVADQSVITQRELVDDIVNENRCAEMAVVCQRVAKNFGSKDVLVQIDMCIEKWVCTYVTILHKYL